MFQPLLHRHLIHTHSRVSVDHLQQLLYSCGQKGRHCPNLGSREVIIASLLVSAAYNEIQGGGSLVSATAHYCALANIHVLDGFSATGYSCYLTGHNRFLTKNILLYRKPCHLLEIVLL